MKNKSLCSQEEIKHARVCKYDGKHYPAGPITDSPCPCMDTFTVEAVKLDEVHEYMFNRYKSILQGNPEDWELVSVKKKDLHEQEVYVGEYKLIFVRKHD